MCASPLWRGTRTAERKDTHFGPGTPAKEKRSPSRVKIRGVDSSGDRTGRCAGVHPGRDTSERILQRELDEPRIANCRVDLRQRTSVFDVRGCWIGKRRMVSQVEKLGAEQHALLFADAKGLANGKVHVRLMRSNKAIARGVAKTGRAIRPDDQCRHGLEERVGVHEVV